MLTINIGKGLTMEVDETKLNDAVMAHVRAIGLRNILMDAHAYVTREEAGDDVQAQSLAASEKKLAAMYAGEARTSSTRTGDPVRAEAIRIALDKIKTALLKAGKKVADYDAKTLRDAAEKKITPEITALAQKRVDEVKALGGDVDVSELTPAA